MIWPPSEKREGAAKRDTPAGNCPIQKSGDLTTDKNKRGGPSSHSKTPLARAAHMSSLLSTLSNLSSPTKAVASPGSDFAVNRASSASQSKVMTEDDGGENPCWPPRPGGPIGIPPSE